MFILKIIGMILLVLLVLLAVLLAVILFVPVRYRLSGEIGQETAVHIKVSWLLHAVSWQGDYEEEQFTPALRILGIRWHKKKPVTFEELEEERAEEDAAEADDGQADKSDKTYVQTQAAKQCVESLTEEPQEKRNTAKQKKEKETGREGFFDRICGMPDRIRQLCRRMIRTVAEAKDKAAAIKELISDADNRRAVSMIFAEVKHLLIHFKFRRIDTDLSFSLQDPAVTGQALGALSMLPFLYRYQIRIYPDFEAEQAYVKGTFQIQGRARIIHVLISLIRLLRQREFRMLLKRVMNQ